MSKKIINITAATMALAVTLSGCATAVVQERKDQAAAAASAEAAQAAVTATPEPTAEPTPEPINAWSLLSNLPDFTPGTLDNPDTTWPDGIPMGQSPLSYDDGSKFYSLRSVDTGKTLDITDVALQDVRDLPVKGYLKLNELENGDTVIGEINAESTGEGVEKEISDFSIHTASKDDGCDYYPIGYNGGSLTLKLDGRAANDDGIDIGDAFLDGLYYSSVTPDKLEGYPTDGEPEEQFNFLYGLFGNPSGLYWTNNDSVAFNSSKQYRTFEDFRDADYDVEIGGKNFYLVWNYDGYSVVAACNDTFDSANVKGTTIQDIYLFPNMTETKYLVENSGSLISGYLGYGEVPVILTGTYASVNSDSTVEQDTSAEENTDAESGDNSTADENAESSSDDNSDSSENSDS